MEINIINVNNDIKKIESTLGFKLLSEKQKRIIRTSIRFEKRYSDLETRGSSKYIATENAHYCINCHLSVLMLEIQAYTGLMENDDIPMTFFEATYSDAVVNNIKHVREFATGLSFPSIIHLSTVPHQTDTHYSVSHTFLALDFQNDQLLLWEKDGFGGAFRVTSANVVLKAYSNCYWGHRQLRSNVILSNPNQSPVTNFQNIPLPDYQPLPFC